MVGFPDTSAEEIPPPIRLPLPALTILGFDLCGDDPSPRLINIMCSIFLAPALASITIGFGGWNITKYPLQVSRLMWIGGWRGFLSTLRLRGACQ